MRAPGLIYNTSVTITDEDETFVTLPVETGDVRLAAAGELCARIVWPLEHEVAGVESVLFRPNSLEVRLKNDYDRPSVETDVFHVLAWVLGGTNITRVPVTN